MVALTERKNFLFGLLPTLGFKASMSTIISVPHLGGKSAAVLFGFVLFSFVIESQLTQVSARNIFNFICTANYFARSMYNPISAFDNHISYCKFS